MVVVVVPGMEAKEGYEGDTYHGHREDRSCKDPNMYLPLECIATHVERQLHVRRITRQFGTDPMS